MSIEFLSEERKAEKQQVAGILVAQFAQDIPEGADGLRVAVESWREELALLHEIHVLRRALGNAQDQGFRRMSDEMHIAQAKREIEGE